jgi:hypothetical protein
VEESNDRRNRKRNTAIHTLKAPASIGDVGALPFAVYLFEPCLSVVDRPAENPLCFCRSTADNHGNYNDEQQHNGDDEHG